MSPEIAGINDIAAENGRFHDEIRKILRLLAGIARTAEIANQEYRDCGVLRVPN